MSQLPFPEACKRCEASEFISETKHHMMQSIRQH